jgi:hypothetical protein
MNFLGGTHAPTGRVDSQNDRFDAVVGKVVMNLLNDRRRLGNHAPDFDNRNLIAEGKMARRPGQSNDENEAEEKEAEDQDDREKSEPDSFLFHIDLPFRPQKMNNR